MPNRLLIVAGLAILHSPVEASSLQGEPDAVALAEQVVERLGGRDAWKNLEYIHVTIRGYPDFPPFTVTEELWTGLTQPHVFFSMSGEDFLYSREFTNEGGRVLRDGILRDLTKAEHDAHVDFWSRSEHVLYYRMATGDPSLGVRLSPPRQLDFYDAESGSPQGVLVLGGNSEPVLWRAKFDDSTIEYVFGPLVEFGALRLPKWGALSDGSWRFETIEVEAGDVPPTFPVIDDATAGDNADPGK